MAGKHISYSEWKNWHICPHYHKLTYIDKVNQFEGNIFTAFGKALHNVCEDSFNLEGKYPQQETLDNLFKKYFVKELKSLPKNEQARAVSDFKLPDFKSHGLEILREVYNAMTDQFGVLGSDWVVLATEEQLYVPITEFEKAEKKFKGFIDLVVATKDGKIHLIDWKTCSWGWDARKKNNKVLAYQLVYYKHFYARKHPEVSIEDIETDFVLLKRTAKAGKKIEFVRVTAGKKRIENALNTLLKALHNIEDRRYTKNRLACTKCPDRFGTCEFYQTEHCR